MYEDDLNFGENQQRAVERFEKMIQNQEEQFFDIGEFLGIIDYYMEFGFFQKAKQVNLIALNQHPYCAAFYVRKARILLAERKYPELFDSLEKAASLDPSESNVFLIRGAAYLSMGDFMDNAKAEFEKALELTDNLEDIHYRIASLYTNYNYPSLAIPHFKECILLDSENEDVLEEIAHCFELLGEHQKSISFLLKFIDDKPYSSEAWFHLGNAYNRIQEYEKAIDAYDYTLIIDEDHPVAGYFKGDSLLQLGNYKEAILVFKELLEKGPVAPDILCAIGECYEGMEMGLEARAYFSQAISLNEDLSDAYYGIGSTYLTEGKFLEAEKNFSKALELDGENSDYWYALADVHYKLNDLQLSEVLFERAVHYNPSDVEAWLDYSSVTFEFDEDNEGLERAINLITHAIEHNPASVSLYYRMVVYKVINGNFKDALHYFELALYMDATGYEEVFEFLPSLRENAAFLALLHQYKI